MTLKLRLVAGGIGGAADQPRKMGRRLKQSTRSVPRKTSKGRRSRGSLGLAARSRGGSPAFVPGASRPGLPPATHASERLVGRSPVRAELALLLPAVSCSWTLDEELPRLPSRRALREEQIPVSCTAVSRRFRVHCFSGVTALLPPSSQRGCSEGFGVAGIVRHPHMQLQAPDRTAVEGMQDPGRPGQGPSLRGQVASAGTAGVPALGGGPEGKPAAAWQRET